MKISRRLALIVVLMPIVGCGHFKKARQSERTTASEELEFVVSFPESVRSEPVTGRVILFLSRSATGEPRFNTGWFNLEPVFAIDVEQWGPGEPLVFSPSDFRNPDALAYPESMSRLDPGTYYAQVLIDADQTRRNFQTGPGNLFSDPLACELNGTKGGAYELIANQVVEEKVYQETEWVKLIKIRSELLSEFHERDVYLRAAALLPPGYDESDEAYPVLYSIPGFGGRHTGLLNFGRGNRFKGWKDGKWPLKLINVRLDPDVPLGHSVFANSANNGPVGDALVRELIPAIEERFRVIAQPGARFLDGHSSGGWSSLWLQVAYPEFFGGCWSTAPDPVDFRAFQTMNIYQDRNGHWTREGYPRPVARNRKDARLMFGDMNHWEYVVGYGGQLDSFDAVFSPRGTDGRPMPLIDKITGAIDSEVAEHWKRYDIRLTLEENWATLGSKLKGKLHIIGGGWDTFYLEGALGYLRDFLETTDHGGYVEIHPGSHGSFVTDDVRQRIQREIAEQFKRWQER